MDGEKNSLRCEKNPLRVETNSDRIEDKRFSVDFHIETLKELSDEELLDYALFVTVSEYATQAELGRRGEELCRRFDDMVKRHFYVPTLHVPTKEQTGRGRRLTEAELEELLNRIDLSDFD